MSNQRGRLYPGCHRFLRGFGGKRGLLHRALQIGIHDDLPVVAQVHRFQFVELLLPFLQVRDVDFVALEVVGRSQVDQHLAGVMVGHHFDVVGIGKINFA